MFFNTLRNHINAHKKVVVVAVIPPLKKDDYERVHGPITHAFPYLGTDQDRVRYRVKVNKLLELLCKQIGYTFFILEIDDYKRSIDASSLCTTYSNRFFKILA